jgi:hypothetical protein
MSSQRARFTCSTLVAAIFVKKGTPFRLGLLQFVKKYQTAITANNFARIGISDYLIISASITYY